MRVIVFGSRWPEDYNPTHEMWLLEQALGDKMPISAIVSGKCPNSPDELGEQWAHEHDADFIGFPADWEKYGKSAGHRRNAEMAAFGGDFAVGLWNGKSNGTMGMIQQCALHRIETLIVPVEYER